MPTIWKSYASWAAADTLRTKPQFGAKGTYCVKRGYVPKKFARRERHTHFLLGMENRDTNSRFS